MGVDPKIGVFSPQNGWWKSWKTHMKMGWFWGGKPIIFGNIRKWTAVKKTFRTLRTHSWEHTGSPLKTFLLEPSFSCESMLVSRVESHFLSTDCHSKGGTSSRYLEEVHHSKTTSEITPCVCAYLLFKDSKTNLKFNITFISMIS